MIESLSIAKACMKGENGTLPGMDIADKSAKRSKAEWIKKAKCYNCDKIEHLAKHCKKPKKAKTDKKTKDNDETDKKTETKKSKNWVKKKKTKQQWAQAAKKDLKSASDSGSDLEAAVMVKRQLVTR